MQDHAQTKEKILRFLRTRGPSLPVHIAKEIEQSILFTSAFLSELLSEKKIKISNMRVGSSPIYFIPGQELQLEKYSENIKGKEKEALLLLKEKKFLQDEIQQPAVRVALREIKDFAIPLEKNNKLIWRYFTISESEFEQKEKEEIKKNEQKHQKEISLLTNQRGEAERNRDSDWAGGQKEIPPEKPEPKELDIFDKKEKPKKKSTPKKATKKKTASKTNEKFFNKVKEFLKSKQIEITEIESIGKNELAFRVNKSGEEQLLFAYNRKQVKEDDLVKANRKASETNLKYTVLCLGEQTKKLNNLIDAIKNLESIEQIE